MNNIALTRPDETDLLSALYQGVLEEPAWATFLARVRRRTRADGIQFLIARSGRDGGSREMVGRRAPSMRRLFPMAACYRAMPAMFDRLRPGRVYTGGELGELCLAMNDGGRSALRERGRHGHIRLLRIVEAGGVNGWLAIGRARADFTAAESTVLSTLAGHLTVALQYHAALLRERFRASIAAPALARRDIGWVMLDRQGHVLDHDPIAARLFHGLSPHGRRRLSIPGGDEAVARALDAIAGGDARGHAIRTSAPAPIHLLLRPAEDLGSGAAAILYAQGHEATGGSERALVDLFALTRGEARLALALAGGQSLMEAGARLGLARETARSYSKALYAKTGTHGQAGLVRLIVLSLADLA